MQPLILASSSPYRQALLEKLCLPFSCASPDIDESQQPGETAQQLVRRLAQSKAEALKHQFPGALIIGSDQVAVLGQHILGKPGTRENAIQQLTACSGKKVTFLTGLALHDNQSGSTQVDIAPFHVYFRTLSDSQVRSYIDKESPLNCAGSFKSEGLGITLFEKLEGEDPNALIGLPLIKLTTMLEKAGLSVL